MSKKKTLGVALVKEVCPVCTQETDGPILMNTRLSESKAKQVEDLHGKVIGFSKEPCPKCKEDMKKAFMFIGAIEEKSDDPKNPYRSGHIWGIKHEVAKEMIQDEKVLKLGFCLIDLKAAKAMGLPIFDNNTTQA